MRAGACGRRRACVRAGRAGAVCAAAVHEPAEGVALGQARACGRTGPPSTPRARVLMDERKGIMQARLSLGRLHRQKTAASTAKMLSSSKSFGPDRGPRRPLVLETASKPGRRAGYGSRQPPRHEAAHSSKTFRAGCCGPPTVQARPPLRPLPPVRPPPPLTAGAIFFFRPGVGAGPPAGRVADRGDGAASRGGVLNGAGPIAARRKDAARGLRSRFKRTHSSTRPQPTPVAGPRGVGAGLAFRPPWPI